MKQIFIESSFSSFEDFHDGDWYERLFIACDGLNIQPAVEDFSAHWWGASRAFVLPCLLVGGVFDASPGARSQFRNKQDLWDHYLEIDAFKGALWKTAEGAYGSIYYAYENLLVSVLNTGHQKKLRITDHDFNSIISKRLGESLAGRLWTNSTVAVAREVRNCLVHRGGKASDRLQKMRPLPKIESEDILISASDVRKLHRELQPKVWMLVNHYANKKDS